MIGILHTLHGSRFPLAQEEALQFLNELKKEVNVPLQAHAYVELQKPSIAEGAVYLVQQGATHIYINPILLLSAGHHQGDIPEEMEKFQQRYPHVTWTIGNPIGVSKMLADIVVERLKENGYDEHNPFHHILLIGRGSRFERTVQDFQHIRHLIQYSFERRHRLSVHQSYLAVLKPSFEDEATRLIQEKEGTIFVVPYLLFNGLLIQRVQKFCQSESNRMVLCPYLFPHRNVVNAFAQEIERGLKRMHKKKVVVKI